MQGIEGNNNGHKGKDPREANDLELDSQIDQMIIKVVNIFFDEVNKLVNMVVAFFKVLKINIANGMKNLPCYRICLCFFLHVVQET